MRVKNTSGLGSVPMPESWLREDEEEEEEDLLRLSQDGEPNSTSSATSSKPATVNVNLIKVLQFILYFPLYDMKK